jgi:mono/diheme cytochrome c family protein
MVKSILIASALIAIALVAGWMMLRPGMLPPTAATGPEVNATTQYLSRGEYLARAGDCVACHTAPTGKPFAGGRAMPTPFGNLYVPNITPDDDTGIGNWTRTDLVWFLQTASKPDGDDSTGLMKEVIEQGYSHLPESELQAIGEYVESLPPVQNKLAEHKHEHEPPN